MTPNQTPGHRTGFIALFVLYGLMFMGKQIAVASSRSPHPLVPALRVRHYMIEDGLRKETWHSAMLKDNQGFLWLGSSHGELSKFDGYTFRQYYRNPRSGGFHYTNCLNLVEDSLHNIWIGTSSGLSRFDIRADTFSNFNSIRDSATLDPIAFPFWATSEGVYCLESGNVFSFYNSRTLERTELMTTSSDAQANLATFAGTVYDQMNNCIWALSAVGEGLVQFVLDKREVIHHKRPVYKKNVSLIPHSNSEAMCFDSKRNCFWINSSDGLTQFTLNDRQFHHIDALNELVDQKTYGRWVGIDIDARGMIWFATMPYGLIVYDPVTKTYSFPDLKGASPEEVAEGNLKIFCDRDGLVWLSYWNIKGICQLIPYHPAVHRYKVSPQRKAASSVFIQNMLAADLGKIWIGTAEDGLHIFDPKRETFSVLNQAELPGIVGKGIVPMVIDTLRHKAWLNAGQPDRVYVMDLHTSACKVILFKDAFGRELAPVNIINFLSIGYDQTILFFDAGHGFFELNKDSLAARLVIDWKASVKGPIPKIIKGEGLDFFILAPAISGPNAYYKRVDGHWHKTAHAFDLLDWTDLLFFDQSYWMAGDNELLHWDRHFQLLKRYTSEDGLLGNIFSILPDGKGKIWFNNDQKAIGYLDVQSGMITLLNEADGYEKQYYNLMSPRAVKTNGDWYVTGNYLSQGETWLDRVMPEKYASTAPAKVYVKSLNINQQPYPYPVNVNSLGSLSLRHFENLINLETGILNFLARGKGSLRYKLEGGGIDENWQFAPYYYTIRYEGLPPGKYKLTMQASNAANEYNGPEKVLHILIHPPFWATWWFRGLSTLLGLAGVYLFVQYRSKQLKKQNIQLEHKIQERTSELNQSLVELRNTQEQLIQSEKMASLGELTSGIAHEIKNPLNFINNFSEINLELIGEMEEDYLTGREYEQANGLPQTVKTLRKNSEKINHHGKRIDEIVKGMLQHSRMGNVSKEMVNINALCEDALKLAYHGFRAKEKGFQVSMETRLEAGLPKVLAIPQEFSRVLLNLINNAFYTVHGKKLKSQEGAFTESLEVESLYIPSVIISTQYLGDKISIKISDNGMGIPEDIGGKIFQPFFTTKPTGEGTGLGLSMAYDIIVKGHGGELKVKSKEGIGTDFEIILPAVPSPSQV